MTTALELTREFMQCTKCFGSKRVRSLVEQWPPRGWAGPDSVKQPSVMLVSLNPGHPVRIKWNGQLRDEPRLFARLRLTKRSFQGCTMGPRAMLAFCRRSYANPAPGRNQLFHRRSIAYARALLWLLGVRGDDAWKTHCWFTDLGKCSTNREHGAYIPVAAIRNCRGHIEREFEFVRPTIIAALGSQAAGRLRTIVAESFPYVHFVHLRHPSGWIRLTDNRQHDAFASLRNTLNANPGEFHSFLAELQEELGRPPTRRVTRSSPAPLLPACGT